MTARILVVDDVPANVRLLEVRLAEAYYDVRSLPNGRDVLALATSWQPDVILTDVMMPGIDGYDLCRLLKADRATRHIPVIMVTALKEAADRLRALACGADEFLIKPIEHEILLARLRSTIRLKHLLDEWHGRSETIRTLGLGATGAGAAFEPGRVLIIDDLAARAARLRAVLSEQGITTMLAQREAAALAAAEYAAFELITINLSLEDPLRLVARFRAAPGTRDTPLLLVAEPDQRGLVISGLDLGANDCIMLPLDETELVLRAGNHIRRKQFQDRLRTGVSSALQLAVTDPLTGLHNRRYLLSHLDELCGKSGNGGFAVLMIDIDHFKSVNDRHGHYAGDQVLQTVACVLRETVRESDLVARYGGEEFVIVLRAMNCEADAAAIAETLREAIEKMPSEHGDGVTISVGVAMSGAAASATALIERADKPLYEAKSFGRNQVITRQPVAGTAAAPARE